METQVESIRLSRAHILSRRRMIFALFIAVAADGLQLITGALGWAGPDQAIDVVAMLLTMWALGFHWLLLPTFALELFPLIDDFPTWTACVIAVIALRRRAERARREQAIAGPNRIADDAGDVARRQHVSLPE